MKKPVALLILPFLLGLAFSSFVSGAEKPALTLWQLPNQSRTQMMSYIMKTGDGQVIVMDGGNKADADYLVKMIREISPGGKVNAWFLTHIHSDHVDALYSIMTEKGGAGLTIDHIYYSFPNAYWLHRYEKGPLKRYQNWLKMLEDYSGSVVTTAGQVIPIGQVKVTVMNDYALAITSNPVNNSSIVFRFDAGKTVLLFPGDLGKEGGKRVMDRHGRTGMKADVIQMAHHGQQGVAEEFYQAVDPSVCLWPTTDWIWTNDFGKGPGTGPLKTEFEKSWIKKLNVKEQYNAKDGLLKVEFK